MRERQRGCRAAHVLLHVEHAGVGLDVEPAGVEADALADQRYPRMCRIAPRQIDQPRRAGGGAADRVNERKILRQQLVADDGADGGGVARGELARGLFELRRAHVVCRRVDQITRQRHAFDDADELVAVEVLRQIELDRMRFALAVARKAVSAERESERGKPRIVRRVGKAIDAVGQLLRQPAGQERVPRFVAGFQPEQHAAEPFLARQQEMPAGLRLETGGVGEGASLRSDCFAHVRVARHGDEPDRHRVRRPARNEDGVHRVLLAQQLTSPQWGRGDPHIHGISEAWITSGTPSPPTERMARSTSFSPKR